MSRVILIIEEIYNIMFVKARTTVSTLYFTRIISIRSHLESVSESQ